jgi:hypothetical protein
MTEESETAAPARASGPTRRGFLTGVGAGVLLSISRPITSLAALDEVIRADVTRVDAAFWRRLPKADFVILGDFGSGFVLPDGKRGQQINPNAKAVADGIRRLVPLAGSGYLMAAGDLIYVPYHEGRPSPQYPSWPQTWEALNLTPYDEAVGILYYSYIKFPGGSTSRFVSQGSNRQRFFCVMGDHDWWHQPRVRSSNRLSFPMDHASYPAKPAPDQPMYLIDARDGGPTPYLEYFANQGEGSDSGNTRFWDFARDGVHWIALSSDANEVLHGTLENAYYLGPFPKGYDPGTENLEKSAQGRWFRQTVGRSRSKWKFVVTHYPPFTSSRNPSSAPDPHNPARYMRWGFERFGIDAVFSGHVHAYERSYSRGVTYVVAGSGGTFETLTYFPIPAPQSIRRVGKYYGFLSARKGRGKIYFEYVTVRTPYVDEPPAVRDRFVLLKGGSLNTRQDIESQVTIHVTGGGGTIHTRRFTATIGESLVGTGVLAKNGGGTLRIQRANPDFTGILQLNQGDVELTAPKAFSERVQVRMRGGRLRVLSGAQRFATPLHMLMSGRIEMLPGASIAFAKSVGTAWGGGTLTISGTIGPRSLRFGTSASGLSTAQLALIRSADEPDARAALTSAGYLQFVAA